MSEITTVVLDAMGGDNAPAAMIDGAIDAISKEKECKKSFWSVLKTS